jgi:uncharacterized membrane protein YjjP (DUF1212 family)
VEFSVAYQKLLKPTNHGEQRIPSINSIDDIANCIAYCLYQTNKEKYIIPYQTTQEKIDAAESFRKTHAQSYNLYISQANELMAKITKDISVQAVKSALPVIRKESQIATSDRLLSIEKKLSLRSQIISGTAVTLAITFLPFLIIVSFNKELRTHAKSLFTQEIGASATASSLINKDKQ